MRTVVLVLGVLIASAPAHAGKRDKVPKDAIVLDTGIVAAETVVMSPDGKHVVVSGTKTAFVDVAPDALTLVAQADYASARGVAFTADGAKVALSAKKTNTFEWGKSSWLGSTYADSHQFGVAYCPDGTLLMAHDDLTVKTPGADERIIRVDGTTSSGVACTGEAAYVASYDSDGRFVQRLQLSDGKVEWTTRFSDDGATVSWLAMRPDTHSVAVGEPHRFQIVWKDGVSTYDSGHQEYYSFDRPAWSSDGRMLGVGGAIYAVDPAGAATLVRRTEIGDVIGFVGDKALIHEKGTLYLVTLESIPPASSL